MAGKTAPGSWTHTRARIAALSRSRPADDPQLAELRRLLEAQRSGHIREVRDARADLLADHVAQVVADAPPLTEKQLARIDAILKAAPREQVAG